MRLIGAGEMSTKQLAETITDGGIHLTNFFNGRLLTAEDLRAEQSANRQQHQQLGRAIGEGIITGLQVQQAASITPVASTGVPAATLTVSAGPDAFPTCRYRCGTGPGSSAADRRRWPLRNM